MQKALLLITGGLFLIIDFTDSRMKHTYQRRKSNEKGYRSVVKTISWRALGTIDTIIISWIIVGNFRFALSIGGVELVYKNVPLLFPREALGTQQLWCC